MTTEVKRLTGGRGRFVVAERLEKGSILIQSAIVVPERWTLPSSVPPGFVTAPGTPVGPVAVVSDGPPLATVLTALSHALDLTEGQPMGHAARSCLLALRIADTLGLSARERADLHLAVLLKDAGCSSNAAKMFAIFGCNDLTAKSDSKVQDWCRLSEAVKFAVTHTMPHATPMERLQKLRDLLRLPGRVMDALTEARCTRGANIARTLGLTDAVADAIFHLDEHWDGKGAPQGLRREEIPLLARISCLSQTMEVFATTYGRERAYSVLKERSGRWFDPSLVRAARSFAKDERFWAGFRNEPHESLLAATDSLLSERMAATTVDAVCNAFAGIVDAKSSFTAEHSFRVADIAVQIATRLGVQPARVTTLRRAALLHDLGKLAVPNLILDKPGPLTTAEFDVVKQHPHYSEQVLSSVPEFERLSEIAAAHHEKLDGSGYYRGMSAPSLDMDMRILAVADIYDALAADRPYRAAMPQEKAMAILLAEAEEGKLDRDCVAAVGEIAQ